MVLGLSRALLSHGRFSVDPLPFPAEQRETGKGRLQGFTRRGESSAGLQTGHTGGVLAASGQSGNGGSRGLQAPEFETLSMSGLQARRFAFGSAVNASTGEFVVGPLLFPSPRAVGAAFVSPALQGGEEVQKNCPESRRHGATSSASARKRREHEGNGGSRGLQAPEST